MHGHRSRLYNPHDRQKQVTHTFHIASYVVILFDTCYMWRVNTCYRRLG